MKFRNRLPAILLLVIVATFSTIHFLGYPPSLTLIAGDNQADLPGYGLTTPMRVKLSNRTNPLITCIYISTPDDGKAKPRLYLFFGKADHYFQSEISLPTDRSMVHKSITFGVTAINLFGMSTCSMVARMGNPEEGPSAPSMPVITQVRGSTTALIEWEDRSDNETAFYIERRRYGTPWVRLATLSRNTTSYVDNKIEPDLIYVYRIVAHNEAQ